MFLTGTLPANTTNTNTNTTTARDTQFSALFIIAPFRTQHPRT